MPSGYLRSRCCRPSLHPLLCFRTRSFASEAHLPSVLNRGRLALVPSNNMRTPSLLSLRDLRLPPSPMALLRCVHKATHRHEEPEDTVANLSSPPLYASGVATPIDNIQRLGHDIKEEPTVPSSIGTFVTLDLPIYQLFVSDQMTCNLVRSLLLGLHSKVSICAHTSPTNPSFFQETCHAKRWYELSFTRSSFKRSSNDIEHIKCERCGVRAWIAQDQFSSVLALQISRRWNMSIERGKDECKTPPTEESTDTK